MFKSLRNDDDALFKQCQEVTDVWRDFNKKSNIKRALQKTDVSIVDEFHPPTIDTLQHVIQKLEKTRVNSSKTGWGRIKANALAFADSLNGHKALFSIFPSENIYTSVLSGAVSTIVLVGVAEMMSPTDCKIINQPRHAQIIEKSGKDSHTASKS